jgi:uncharacterized protein
MKPIFVDTGYWIALLYPKDTLHRTAQALHESMLAQTYKLVSSELVLIEFANFFASSGSNSRQKVADFVQQIRQNSNVIITPHTAALFDRALTLYAQRPDKQWSLTDCSSFLIMQDLGITEALAYDKHFEQAGFQVLLRQ